KQRLSVKPGITGLWQISPTRNSEISHNLEYDFYYIENRSVALDIVIMFMTIFWVFRGHTH
ncbi:MAG: sugar transferase, partial [Nitrosopumilus sp.]